MCVRDIQTKMRKIELRKRKRERITFIQHEQLGYKEKEK